MKTTYMKANGWTGLLLVALIAALTLPVGAENLQVRVVVTQAGTNFAYTIYNDELLTSGRFINNWSMELHAPAEVLAKPAGWDFETDNRSYVAWFSTDTEEPFAHDIGPGESLSGFVVGSGVSSAEELAFSASSWVHGSTSSGPSMVQSVKAPSVMNYAAQIVNVTHSAEGFRFGVQGVPTLRYSVESSEDLISWTQVMVAASPFVFEDKPPLTSGGRYFRITYVDRFGEVSDQE